MSSRPPDQPRLILASTSESRRQILDALGLRYRVEVPDFEEVVQPGIAAEDLAEALALGKARSVSRRFEDMLTLGADQLLFLGGELLRKPENAIEARAQLEKLNGKRHMLITGMALVCEKTHALRVCHEMTQLSMRHLDPAELDRYAATEEWKGCVGSYRLEGQGLKLFERIEGDHTNARGLPAIRLCNALRELGVPLFG